MALKHQTGSLARPLSGVVDRFQTRSIETGADSRDGRAEPSYRDCDGRAEPSYRDCDGRAEPSYRDCDGRAEPSYRDCQVNGKLVDRPPRYWARASREPAILGIRNGRQPQLDNTLRPY